MSQDIINFQPSSKELVARRLCVLLARALRCLSHRHFSVVTMSQKHSLIKLPYLSPKVLTSDSV